MVNVNRLVYIICILCDLLWSDPDKEANDYDENDRGVSVIFGEKVVIDFNKKNDLDLIIRAHQVVDDGYEFFANRQLITIFSAPNYCGIGNGIHSRTDMQACERPSESGS